MPLPSNVGTGTVELRILDKNGDPITGKVRFEPSVDKLLNVSADPSPVIILPEPVEVQINQDGSLSHELIATDDADNNPVGWTYTAIFVLNNASLDPIPFALPQDTTVDLAEVAPVSSSGGVFITRGYGVAEGGSTGQVLRKTAVATEWDTLTPSDIGAPLKIDEDYFKKVEEGLIATRGRRGPVATDFTSVNIGAGADAALTKSYAIAANAYPAEWPVESPQGLAYLSGNNEVTYFSRVSGNRTMRLMTDAPKVQWGSNSVASHGYRIYIDGRPTSIDPILSHTTIGFNNIIFPDARPRLIEIETGAGLYSVAVAPPYRAWKPPPRRGPRVLIMGDSYVVAAGPANIQNGIYQNIGAEIGTEDFWIDGVSGSGFLQGAGANQSLRQRLEPFTYAGSGLTWDVQLVNPDVVIFHGGGTNDLAGGHTVAAIIAEAVLCFQTARAKLPNARLVFLDGFSPAARSTYNANYILIRQGLQAQLGATGVYYVDVATAPSWLDGTGYAGAPSGSGNSDIYVSADALHYNDLGGRYIQRRLAPKLRRIMSDRGALLNQVI